jgi:hypothetical protein
MQKRLEADLVSLAHSILQMKNKDDVTLLHKKAHEIYEKLSVLKFIDDYLATTPNTTETKEEIIEKIESFLVESNEKETEPVAEMEKGLVEEKEEEVVEIELSAELDIESETEETDRSVEVTAKTPILQTSLEEELKDAISADVATQLFEKATKENPEVKTVEKVETDKRRSLNDTLFKNNIQVGLNDRIAFVKHLFQGSQEDFNRVLSQLNTFKTEKEAKSFINKMVKPDYDWKSKEEYSDRLFELIERKFS